MQDTQASNATRWSLIVAAQGSGIERRAALGQLLSYYDDYVLWLIRRHRRPPDSSCEELKQEFLEGVLRRDDIAKLDRTRGSFRAWLKLAVQRFLFNEWEKWRASRHGRRDTTPLRVELVDPEALPDAACAREFGRQLILYTLQRQRKQARDLARFDALVRFLPGPQLDIAQLGPLAQELDSNPNALARAIWGMRERFGELLRDSIRDLLYVPTSEGEPTPLDIERAVDEELAELRKHLWS